MDIYEKIKALKLPIDEYVVTGGSALERYGIRKSGDIDICVTENLYRQLKESGWKVVTKGDGLETLTKGNVEAAVKWGYGKYDISVSALYESSNVINGVRFIDLKTLLDYKKTIGRSKDKKDIELIEEYLKSV